MRARKNGKSGGAELFETIFDRKAFGPRGRGRGSGGGRRSHRIACAGRPRSPRLGAVNHFRARRNRQRKGVSAALGLKRFMSKEERRYLRAQPLKPLDWLTTNVSVRTLGAGERSRGRPECGCEKSRRGSAVAISTNSGAPRAPMSRRAPLSPVRPIAASNKPRPRSTGLPRRSPSDALRLALPDATGRSRSAALELCGMSPSSTTPPTTKPPRRKTRFITLILSRMSWVEPQLVAEITYLTWTEDGPLRHSIRSDKPARDVRRETPRRGFGTQRG